MKCDACRKNTATYLYEETKNGETRTYHLCPECAARLSGAQDFPDFEWPFGLFSHNPLEDFFGDLLPLSHGGHAQRQGRPARVAARTFPDCRRKARPSARNVMTPSGRNCATPSASSTAA